MNRLTNTLLAVTLCAMAGCGPGTDDMDPLAEENLGSSEDAVTCSAGVSVFPVRGRHNTGYDSTAGNSSLWSCNADYSNSDYWYPNHLGNDIWAARGTPVAATRSGYLVLTGWSSYSGWKVTIKDGCGWYHFYAHLDHLASGIVNGARVTAGQIVGYVGNTGTASNGVVHLHYSLYPDNNYNAGIDPWRYLRAVESNVCTAASTSPTKYWVDTFAKAAGRDRPSTSGVQQGWLYAGTNYVYCKTWGGLVSAGGSYNHWWLKTDLDEVFAGKSGRAWVSAYYLSRWGNDEAKDNSGRVIPNCP